MVIMLVSLFPKNLQKIYADLVLICICRILLDSFIGHSGFGNLPLILRERICQEMVCRLMLS